MYSLLRKALYIAVFVSIYFLGIREIRALIHDAHLGTVLPEQYGQISSELSFYPQSSVSFTFFKTGTEFKPEWQYKIPFGLFFLLAILGLISIGADNRMFVYLVSIHFAAGLLSFLMMVIAVNGLRSFIIIPDLISRYLIPLCSLGLVALTYLEQKNKISEYEGT